jgi:hypothetical protein
MRDTLDVGLGRPQWKAARSEQPVHEGKTLLYRASKFDCDVCLLKPQRSPKDASRDIREHA